MTGQTSKLSEPLIIPYHIIPCPMSLEVLVRQFFSRPLAAKGSWMRRALAIGDVHRMGTQVELTAKVSLQRLVNYAEPVLKPIS